MRVVALLAIARAGEPRGLFRFSAVRSACSVMACSLPSWALCAAQEWDEWPWFSIVSAGTVLDPTAAREKQCQSVSSTIQSQQEEPTRTDLPRGLYAVDQRIRREADRKSNCPIQYPPTRPTLPTKRNCYSLSASAACHPRNSWSHLRTDAFQYPGSFAR